MYQDPLQQGQFVMALPTKRIFSVKKSLMRETWYLS